MQSQYLRTLDALQEIFSNQPFLLGNQPTRADFGLMAPFFRHFSSDPTPRKILQQRAPAVMEWVARMWNCRRSTLSTLKEEHHHQVVGLPKGLEALVPLLKEYLVYLDLNARAWTRGESQFTATFQGVESQVIWFLSKTFAKKISFFCRCKQCPSEFGVGLSCKEEWRR